MIWVEQVKNREVHNPSLYYVLLKKVIPDTASIEPKQVNIFKVPLFISVRPSKGVLAKSNFFKKNQTLNLAPESNN